MAAQPKPSCAVSREAVLLDTFEGIRAEALDLLARRSEINRQIRGLYKFLHCLESLSVTNQRCTTVETGEKLTGIARTSVPSLSVDESRPVGQQLSRQTGPSRLSQHGRLRRACRIALLEAGGTASLEQIRQLIVRRESWAFAESGATVQLIVETLHRMEMSGELRCVESHSSTLWEQVAALDDGDPSSKMISKSNNSRSLRLPCGMNR